MNWNLRSQQIMGSENDEKRAGQLLLGHVTGHKRSKSGRQGLIAELAKDHLSTPPSMRIRGSSNPI